MLDHPFQLGDPISHRGIVITPLFPRRDPTASYLPLEAALAQGLRISEIDAAGSVPELTVDNPLTTDVLLYDGEELTGAKQNRILNVSVLVGAKTTLPIPVSCVEQDRWQMRSEAFAAAPHAAHPRLRRRKASVLLAQPLARGVAQADVWDEVAVTAQRLNVRSATAANADAFRTHRTSLAELEEAFPLQPGQCGAILALGDDLCLDAVSRPDAFAELWPKLRVGYLLDALDRLDRPDGDPATARTFSAALAHARITLRPSAGRGEDIRFGTSRIIGSGLQLNDELIQLSAFTPSVGASASGRISRPTRRRGR